MQKNCFDKGMQDQIGKRQAPGGTKEVRDEHSRSEHAGAVSDGEEEAHDGRDRAILRSGQAYGACVCEQAGQ